MERTSYGIVIVLVVRRDRPKWFTREKIGPRGGRPPIGHRSCSWAAEPPFAERTALMNTNTIRSVLVVAAAATLLSLAPRESFAQG
jgi:hypothetical protein